MVLDYRHKNYINLNEADCFRELCFAIDDIERFQNSQDDLLLLDGLAFEAYRVFKSDFGKSRCILILHLFFLIDLTQKKGNWASTVYIY